MSGKHTRTLGRVNTSPREFEDFFEGWLVRQEHYVDELRSTLQTCHESSDEDLRDLIARVLAHYQQYYEEKSRIANWNVFLVFSPPWFSPLERTFFWVGGFKPGLAFRIVEGSVDDLSEEQAERMESLKVETRAEEAELTNERARIQESVAAPPVLEMARRRTRTTAGLVDGEYDEAEEAIETLRGAMERVLGNADMLRTRTAERVAEILTPVQNVKFLTAVTELQLKIRMLGSQIQAGRG